MGDRLNGVNVVYIYCEESGFFKVGRIVESLDPRSIEDVEGPSIDGPIQMRFCVHIRRSGLKTRLGQWLGIFKKSKLTYRTIRKQCAKRNKFK